MEERVSSLMPHNLLCQGQTHQHLWQMLGALLHRPTTSAAPSLTPPSAAAALVELLGSASLGAVGASTIWCLVALPNNLCLPPADTPSAAAALVGRLGSAPLGAVGASTILHNFSGFLFSFLMVVTTPRVARAVANADMAEVGSTRDAALCLTVCLLPLAWALGSSSMSFKVLQSCESGECGTLPDGPTVLVVCWCTSTYEGPPAEALCLCAAGICHHCSGPVGCRHLWLGSGDCDVGWCPLCDGT